MPFLHEVSAHKALACLIKSSSWLAIQTLLDGVAAINSKGYFPD